MTPYDKTFRGMLVNAGAPEVVLDVYDECVYLADPARIPYVFGGGHPSMTIGKGLDCSSALSRALEWKAKIISHETGVREALDTHGLAALGEPGEGRFVTWFTINNPELHHCVLRITVTTMSGAKRVRWWAGRHADTLIGWLPYTFDPTGYQARRRAA